MNTEPLRIAHIVGKWVGGGVESVVMNYYRHLDRNKIQFDFICDNDSTNIPYEEIKQLGGKVILVSPYQKILKYSKELYQILKKGNYKIVHSHINCMSVFSLKMAKKAKIPIRIAHSHSTTNKKEIKKNILKQILRPFSKLYATNYMCCSELAGRWLFGNKSYNNGKVYLLNNAIDIEKFKYNEKIRKQKRQELNIAENTLAIGHIGRFVEQKNHSFLIKIFYNIHRQNKNSTLLLIGQGPLLNKIKEMVNTLHLNDSVKFLGQRNDVSELYQAIDVFVMPSLYEGLPVVGIEAQMSGLLCEFSNCMTQETKILESTRFISLQENSEKWSKQILNDVKQNQRIKIDNMSVMRFNINTQVKKLENYYMNLLKTNS